MDDKTRKIEIWKWIAAEMKKRNFDLGENGADKLKTKWDNLQKPYKAYKKHENDTGFGASDHKKPPFYAEIDKILGRVFLFRNSSCLLSCHFLLYLLYVASDNTYFYKRVF